MAGTKQTMSVGSGCHIGKLLVHSSAWWTITFGVYGSSETARNYSGDCSIIFSLERGICCVRSSNSVQAKANLSTCPESFQTFSDELVKSNRQ